MKKGTSERKTDTEREREREEEEGTGCPWNSEVSFRTKARLWRYAGKYPSASEMGNGMNGRRDI